MTVYTDYEGNPQTDYPNDDPELNRAVKEWLDEAPWFSTDPVLKEAAIELDSKLHLEGVPPGKARFRHVEDRLRKAMPERFFDLPTRKIQWSDIGDPVERKQAREGFERLQHTLQYTTKKMTEQEYLKDYFGK
jgi:hypothetical protein